ncbi:hypothetical protein H4R18_004332 [Coemansia javaensis]|uniref:Ubiquitin-protein ligase E3A N-terminal zinc-binding domain-containing protein n=1 Tax=Coemansia javaensis TaxID=2761396 RepID=A0A9W8H6H1_9FUNG|nr:hypothetical protein H4R18_004332 [Coemansia javaensis]
MRPAAEFSLVLRCRAAAASDDTRHADKIYLPPSYLSALLDRRPAKPPGRRRPTHSADDDSDTALAFGDGDRLPSPLILRLVPRQAAPSGVVYCGVREFSSDEGEAGIPEWLMQGAGLLAGDLVAVELVRAEKGTSATLQALDPAARSVGDLRALLEAHMRSRMTALFVGERFHVPVGGMAQALPFAVVALEPADVVDIVDTDLSVDIIHADGAPDDNHAEELAPGAPRRVATAGDQPHTFQLHIPAHVAAVDIVLTCEPGSDASLCASRIVRGVGIADNTWFDYSPPSQQPKRLRIERDQLPSGSNSVYVSVTGFPGACKAAIEARFDEPPADAQAAVPAGSPSPGERLCTNCGSSVPAARFEMHQVVCERHNTKCPRCPRVFKRGSAELERHWHCEACGAAGEQGDRDKHDYFYHTPRACSCDASHSHASLAELAEHRRTRCPERLIECRYCHTIVAQGPAATAPEALLLGQHAHEWDCGSRSIACAKCKANVSIRKVQVHMRVHEMKEEARRARMVPCSNRECSRERGDNLLGLCAACFGPLYTGQYDPDNHKLLKRLARSLHAQLTVGCGSPKCRNLHCATGRGHAGSAAAPLSQTEAAAMLVPILRAYAPLAAAGHPAIDYAAIDLHLCV